MFDLQFPTPQAWLDEVLSHFDAFLIDHAAAERKASGMALSMVTHYPDKPELMTRLTDIAVEELAHFQQVMGILVARKITPTPDTKDRYVNGLLKLMRKGTDVYMLDRLLIASIIEARGCERFQLIADNIQDESLRAFYAGIAESEARHYLDFLEIAEWYFPVDVIEARLAQLLPAEAEIVKSLPIQAALH